MSAPIHKHGGPDLPLSEVADWPLEMRTIINLIMDSRFPMFLAWGPELRFFYNDAYATILGDKHPAAMGRPFSQVWAEIWPVIEPLCQRTLSGEASFFEDLPLLMLRNGYEEQTWFTFSYSPVYDCNGKVNGVFCACTETTTNVINERNQALLISLEDRLRRLSDPGEMMSLGAQMLGTHLKASKAGYLEVEADQNTFVYRTLWTNGHCKDLTGQRGQLEDYGVAERLRAGFSVCINDVVTCNEPRVAAAAVNYEAIEARAYIAVPLIRHGNFSTIVFVDSTVPRRWHKDEDALVQAVAERISHAIDRTRAEQLLQQSEAHFREMADYAPVMIWTTDPNGYCTYVNKTWLSYTGQSMEAGLGAGWLDVIHEDDRAMTEAAFTSANRQQQSFSVEYRLKTAAGDYRWVLDTAEPHFDEHQAYMGYVGSVIDIHDRKTAELALFTSNSRFRAAIDAVEGVIWTNDTHGRMTGEQPGWEALTGQRYSEYQGYGWTRAVHPDDMQPTVEAWQAAVAQQSNFHWEHRIRRADGVWRRYSIHAIPIKNAAGKIQEWVGVHTDITQRRENEESIAHMAAHDTLTGLINRRSFNQQLEICVRDAKEINGSVHVLYIDIDRFKEVNDTLGHHVGDMLLVAIAKRLRNRIRKSDFVARLSGDEFGILCKNHQHIEELAEHLIYELSRPYSLDDHYVVSSASIGITCYPDDSQQPSQLLMNADMAMYNAKNSGRSIYQFYSRDMEQVAKRRQLIKLGLQRALAGGELQMYYQPVLHMQSQALCGIEALLRWPATDLPFATTTDLIAVAEDSGLIIELGEWTLRTACQQAKLLQHQGFYLPVAVNVSSHQLQAPRFIELIDQILEDYELEPRYLDIEITERVLMENNASNRDAIQTLNDKGIQISVDDFGTGFSSLSYLKHFAVTTLKIDQTFIRGLPCDKQDGAITSAIVNLAHGLGINVVAEGIETEEQMAFLQALDCQRGQGFHLSYPVPFDNLLSQLKNGEWQHLSPAEMHHA